MYVFLCLCVNSSSLFVNCECIFTAANICKHDERNSEAEGNRENPFEWVSKKCRLINWEKRFFQQTFQHYPRSQKENFYKPLKSAFLENYLKCCFQCN
jgi:hypothetical protein